MRAPLDADRRELRKAFELLALALRHPDLCAGALGEVGHATEVVEVAVRDEDPCAGRAEPGELEAEIRRIAARIDDSALRRASLSPDDVAVRLNQDELVSVVRQPYVGGVMCRM